MNKHDSYTVFAPANFPYSFKNRCVHHVLTARQQIKKEKWSMYVQAARAIGSIYSHRITLWSSLADANAQYCFL